MVVGNYRIGIHLHVGVVTVHTDRTAAAVICCAVIGNGYALQDQGGVIQQIDCTAAVTVVGTGQGAANHSQRCVLFYMEHLAVCLGARRLCQTSVNGVAIGLDGDLDICRNVVRIG